MPFRFNPCATCCLQCDSDVEECFVGAHPATVDVIIPEGWNDPAGANKCTNCDSIGGQTYTLDEGSLSRSYCGKHFTATGVIYTYEELAFCTHRKGAIDYTFDLIVDLVIDCQSDKCFLDCAVCLQAEVGQPSYCNFWGFHNVSGGAKKPSYTLTQYSEFCNLVADCDICDDYPASVTVEV